MPSTAQLPGPSRPGPEQTVAENALVFEQLSRLVERRVHEGRLDAAMGWARAAAAFAATNPTGALRSTRIERALDTVARRAMPDDPDPAPGRTGGRRVLHVLSEAHLIGGHIRMALRWIALDDGHRSSIVVTRPGLDSPDLYTAVASGGGTVDVLRGTSLLGRARRLRELARDADIVVCHTHADDPVPAVAFGGSYRGAPVILLNHADHVFWLGTGNISLVANLRATGGDLTVGGRGYPASSCAFLPTPVCLSRSLSRAEAKARLGIDPRQVVALTLAREIKYRPAPPHPGFVEVVEPVFRNEPGTMLMAVGPSLSEPAWARLAASLGDRVRVMGPQADPAPFLDAADVYLDSFPFGSTTSMLEAATRDLPILSSRQYGGLARLLTSEGMLDEAVLTVASTDEYRRSLADLLRNGELRRRAGMAAGTAVRETHGQAQWKARLAALYEWALATPPLLKRSEPSGFPPENLDAYAAALLGIEAATPLLWSLLLITENLDRRDRLQLLARTTVLRARHRLRTQSPGPGGVDGPWLLPRWTSETS